MFDTLMLNNKIFMEIRIHQEFGRDLALSQKKYHSSSCLGPLNSSWEIRPSLSLSSWAKISSTSLSWSSIILRASSPCSPPAFCIVCIEVDLLEDIDRGGPLLGVNQLDLKEESGAARNYIASALVAITESRRNDQLPLLP